MDASSAQWVQGVLIALGALSVAILGFVLSEVAAYRRRQRLETARVSYETVFVSENRAPDQLVYRPCFFMPPVGLGPAVAVVDPDSARYWNVVITPQYPRFPIVFDSETRALPGSALQVVVRRDRVTGEVIDISPQPSTREETLPV